MNEERQSLPLYTVKLRRNHLVKYSHRRMRDLKAVNDWKKRRMRRVGAKEEGVQKNIIH